MQIERIQSNVNNELSNVVSQKTNASEIRLIGGKSSNRAETVQPTVNQKIKEENQKHEEPTVEEVQEQVDKLNGIATIIGSKVTFKIHQETGRVLARVVSLDTGEVIREVPSERIVEMMAKMRETFGVGIMLDEEG